MGLKRRKREYDDDNDEGRECAATEIELLENGNSASRETKRPRKDQKG